MDPLDELAAQRKLLNEPTDYLYPATPFENIGFALSGGGFRAAVYGLGVLSLLHRIKLEDGSPLLEKIKFVSSASGGTLVLAPYAASLHQRLPFEAFYQHLLEQTAGEGILRRAIDLLKDNSEWREEGKSRNIINAFARAYDECLFSFVPQRENRTLGFIMNKSPNNVHLKEYCFNATEFYTGISFRFQGGSAWTGQRGAPFGNANIQPTGMPGADPAADASLKKIRLGDVTAASSCFPLGFEPIMYPKDFSYPGGCSEQELKDALTLLTNSWDDKRSPEENARSGRAVGEHEFATQKTFALMDGGICDNQGLLSLLLANGRKGEGTSSGKDAHRFELMMVSDVTSYFMKPYRQAPFKMQGGALQKPLIHYWASLRSGYGQVKRAVSLSPALIIVLLLLGALPFILEGPHLAGWILAGLCLLLSGAIYFLQKKLNDVEAKNPLIGKIFSAASPKEAISRLMKKESFAKRTAEKIADYLGGVPVSVLIKMLTERAQSAQTMISEVFLKHIRRLIYDFLYKNDRYQYRRISNPIYKLTFTNQKRPDTPEFEPREDEEPGVYQERRDAFLKEVKESCAVTDQMREVAEKAYSMGTTLWFEENTEQGGETFQKALLATGQFTTCHSLLAYTLRLKHSRHFAGAGQNSRQRILLIETQLKELMHEFAKDPYWLYDKTENEGGERASTNGASL